MKDINKKISPTISKKINNFVKKLSSKINASSEEIKDFEEEMNSNLKSSFLDLIDQGFSESEAIKIAFSKFGDIKYLKDELNQIYEIKKVYAKFLFRVTSIVGIIGIALLLFFNIFNSFFVPNEINKAFKTISEEISQNGTDNNHFKNEIKTIVDNSKFIDAIVVEYELDYVIENNIGDRRIYNYPEDINLYRTYDNNESEYTGLDIEKENKFIYYDVYYSNSTKYSLKSMNYNISLKAMQLNYTIFLIGEIFLIVYWVMFAVWSSLNIFFNNSNKLWILLIALTNLLGYLIYSLYHKRKNNM